MAGFRTVTDHVCLACGTLCDDLTLTVDEADRLHDLKPDCTLARSWFERASGRRDGPPAAVRGQPTTLNAALGHAADWLRAARSPRLLGLETASIETQRIAVALADRIGAVVEVGSPESRARLAAMARVGRCSATLGEARARADLVLLWACDPVTTHPRFLTRHVDPPGRFMTSARRIVVVDSTPNATSARAAVTLAVAPRRRIAALATLRALLRRAPLDATRILATTGQTLDTWRSLADDLRSARYGVAVTGSALDDPAEYEALLVLVRDLNQRPDGRFVHLSLGAPGNAAGAEAVLGWQAGFAPDVTFAPGYPAQFDASATHPPPDLLLTLSDDFAVGSIPPAEIPTIRIAPDATVVSPAPAVAIATAPLGIRAGGTVLRNDGATLPTSNVLPASLPDAASVLRELLQRVAIAGQQGDIP